MAEPFISQIEDVCLQFRAEKGWALCAGQILPINQNQAALFSCLARLSAATARPLSHCHPTCADELANGCGQGSGLANYTLGQRGGEETHTLTVTGNAVPQSPDQR